MIGIGKKTTMAAVIGTASLAASANAELIAYWNFSNYDGSGTSIAASHGTGTLSLGQWGGTHSDVTGTTMNAMFGGAPGSALELRNGSGGNDTPMTLTFSMSGLQDLVLSYAIANSHNTQVFTSGTWAWSIDGVNFTSIAGSHHATSQDWETKVVDLSGITALNDAATVTLQFTLDGAGNANARKRLDNFKAEASLIPAPGALALLGIAALIGVPRRRKG